MDAKVYIGDLGNHASEREIEDAFSRYGPLRNIFVARRPPGFAFVEFQDQRDADDAARALDGRMLCGRRVRVEVSHGRSRWPGGRPPSYLLKRPAPRYVAENERCHECGRIGHRSRECFRLLRQEQLRRDSPPKYARRHSRSRSRDRNRSRRRGSTRSRSRSRNRLRTRSKSGSNKGKSRSPAPQTSGSSR